ncbi:MAG: class I SAM-dependent methyltransferase [Promethearchaeota archaeon]
MAQKTSRHKTQTKREYEIKNNHIRVTEGLGNGLAINFLKEFIEPFIITTEIANGIKCGFFDAFQDNGDSYVATKEEIIEYATTGNGNGKGFVAIDDKDPQFDKSKFSQKLEKWLELMESSQIIRRDNGTFCLEPLAVHFRSEMNGIIRSLLNETLVWTKTLDENVISNIWSRHSIDSLIGTQKYDFIENHLEACCSVLCRDIPNFLEEFDIKLKKDSIVMDIGCGIGYFLEELARLYKIRGVGLDFNWKAVENGNKRLKKLGLGRMINLRYMDVAKQKLPANNDLVDLVLTINLHQYFKSEHYEHLTNEIYRILKPGGTYFSIVAVELPEDHPSKRLSIGMHSQLSKIFTDFTEFVDMTHIRELYENAGFNLKTFETLPLYGGIQEIIVVKKP